VSIYAKALVFCFQSLKLLIAYFTPGANVGIKVVYVDGKITMRRGISLRMLWIFVGILMHVGVSFQ